MTNTDNMKVLIFATALATQPHATQLILNGGFELGLTNWTIANQVGSDGAFLLQSGTTSPVNGDLVPL